MTSDEIINFLDDASIVVRSASPFMTMMGIPFANNIASWAETAISVGRNVLDRAKEGKIVLSSEDKVEINKRIDALEAVNAELNAKIAAW